MSETSPLEMKGVLKALIRAHAQSEGTLDLVDVLSAGLCRYVRENGIFAELDAELNGRNEVILHGVGWRKDGDGIQLLVEPARKIAGDRSTRGPVDLGPLSPTSLGGTLMSHAIRDKVYGRSRSPTSSQDQGEKK